MFASEATATATATATAEKSHWIPVFAGMTSKDSGKGNNNSNDNTCYTTNISDSSHTTINRIAKNKDTRSAAQASHAH